jgi:hypothetical protein
VGPTKPNQTPSFGDEDPRDVSRAPAAPAAAQRLRFCQPTQRAEGDIDERRALDDITDPELFLPPSPLDMTDNPTHLLHHRRVNCTAKINIDQGLLLLFPKRTVSLLFYLHIFS